MKPRKEGELTFALYHALPSFLYQLLQRDKQGIYELRCRLNEQPNGLLYHQFETMFIMPAGVKQN